MDAITSESTVTQMEVKTYMIRNLVGTDTEVDVHLTMNGLTAVIIRESRRFLPDYEPIETTMARALRSAADFLERGPVNLVYTSRMYVCRN